VVAIVAAGVVVGATVAGGAPQRTDPTPIEVRQHAADWALPHRDYSNSRATADSSINASNVASLQVAWTKVMPGRGLFGNLASTPLIVGDTAYVQDLESNVWALALADGGVKWKRTYVQPVIGPNGVGIGYGKVFAVVGRGTVVALSAKTGKTVWSRSIDLYPKDGVSIQPTVVDGLVLLSTFPGNIKAQNFPAGVRGVIQVLDAQTGNVVWKFDTVKGNLWGHPEVNSGGGAWYPPAVDLRRGVAYWGTGNPGPWPGTSQYPGGKSRKGPNLYSDSVLAIGLRDGKLRWYQAPNPHDLFDHDLQLTMLVQDKTGRDLVIASAKLGIVFAFDAKTGSSEWKTPVGTHLNDDLKELPRATRVSPGPLGGVITPMAHAGGVIYVPVVENAATYVPGIPNYVDNFQLGGGAGTFVALDATTGAVLWEHKLPSAMDLGGATVVNDLVFTSTADGVVYALDRATGAEVWRYRAPGGINGWPAVAGNTILVPVGLSEPAAQVVALRLHS
jgi:alcohol dehydrogenase (cytochrome c)